MNARPKAKRLEYAAGVDRAGRVSGGEGEPIALGEEWNPETLVLAGLALCSIASLRYHARRASLDLVAGAEAEGVVTRREGDGRYAFVRVECRLDVELDPPPEPEALQQLLQKAERDCFVSASLTVAPRYAWRVNGADVR